MSTPAWGRTWEALTAGATDASAETRADRVGRPDATAGDDGRCVCGAWGCHGRCVPGHDREMARWSRW